jgi:hypothetical protein
MFLLSMYIKYVKMKNKSFNFIGIFLLLFLVIELKSLIFTIYFKMVKIH